MRQVFIREGKKRKRKTEGVRGKRPKRGGGGVREEQKKCWKFWFLMRGVPLWALEVRRLYFQVPSASEVSPGCSFSRQAPLQIDIYANKHLYLSAELR